MNNGIVLLSKIIRRRFSSSSRPQMIYPCRVRIAKCILRRPVVSCIVDGYAIGQAGHSTAGHHQPSQQKTQYLPLQNIANLIRNLQRDVFARNVRYTACCISVEHLQRWSFRQQGTEHYCFGDVDFRVHRTCSSVMNSLSARGGPKQ